MNAEKKALEKYPIISRPSIIDSNKMVDVNATSRKRYLEAYEEGVKDTLDKVCRLLRDSVTIDKKVETAENGEPMADSYIDFAMERLKAADQVVEDFMRRIKEMD